jgi:hypothetical protein
MISPQLFIEQPLLIVRRSKLHNQKSRSSLFRSFHFWGTDNHRVLTNKTFTLKHMVNNTSVDNKHQNIIYSENSLSISPFLVFDDNTRICKIDMIR